MDRLDSISADLEAMAERLDEAQSTEAVAARRSHIGAIYKPVYDALGAPPGPGEYLTSQSSGELPQQSNAEDAAPNDAEEKAPGDEEVNEEEVPDDEESDEDQVPDEDELEDEDPDVSEFGNEESGDGELEDEESDNGEALKLTASEEELSDDEMLIDAATEELDYTHTELGDGDLHIGTGVMPVHVWLGDQYSERIQEFRYQRGCPPSQIPHLESTLAPHQETAVLMGRWAIQSSWRGFINGDQMGVGKTLSALATCQLDTERPHGAFNLIVTLASCTSQWVEEIHQHFSDKVKVLADPPSTLSGIDIVNGGYDYVIVSYDQIRQQYHRYRAYQKYCVARREFGLMQAIKKGLIRGKMTKPNTPLISDFRKKEGPYIRHLVLDEAHFVRDSALITHRALQRLAYDYAILLSGTFFANRWSDIEGLLWFLRGHPFTTKEQFMRVFGGDPDERLYTQSKTGTNRLIKFLQGCLFARPSTVLDLPEKEEKVIQFSLDGNSAKNVAIETARYHNLMKRFSATKHAAQRKRLLKSAMLTASYAQAHATNPHLAAVMKIGQNTEADSGHAAEIWDRIKDRVKILCGEDADLQQMFRKSDAGELQVLLQAARQDVDNLSDPSAADLKGKAADKKKQQKNKKKRAAPATSTQVETLTTREASNVQTTAEKEYYAKSSTEFDPSLLTDDELASPRVECVAETIMSIRKEQPEARIVLFSCRLRPLDLVAELLKRRHRLDVIRFDGKKDKHERVVIREHFATSDDHLPIFVTADAGGTGLNLPAGTHVILMEPWWNMNRELQAIFRLWRPGQTQKVQIIRIVAENSLIDMVIIDIRDKKMEHNGVLVDGLRAPDDVDLPIPEILPTWSEAELDMMELDEDALMKYHGE